MLPVSIDMSRCTDK